MTTTAETLATDNSNRYSSTAGMPTTAGMQKTAERQKL
jgi:hypothetical protein